MRDNDNILMENLYRDKFEDESDFNTVSLDDVLRQMFDGYLNTPDEKVEEYINALKAGINDIERSWEKHENL